MAPRLSDLMHDRADRLSPPVVDLDAVVSTGERLVRRRRALAGAGMATATAAVLLGAVALPQLGPGNGPGRTPGSQFSFAGAFADRSPAYAVGTSFHVAGRDFTVPTEVHAFVQTTEGVVYADRKGDVWSATGDERPFKVGSIDPEEPRLTADGPRAAWAQPTDNGAELALLDQTEGSVVALPASAGPDAVDVYALDDEVVYARDGRDVVQWDTTEQESTVLMPWTGDLELADVEQGLVAYRAQPSPESGDVVSRVTRTVGEGGEIAAWNMLDLSDDGTRLLGETDPDVFALFDVATGSHENVTVPGYEFVVGYRWLDADTYLMIGMNPPYANASVDILECEVGGDCTVAAPQIGSFDDGLVLSFGEPMDG
ncbi:hypothetical protein [Nocardioides jishulii]|uniref:WD40 repeat domain-containing protein n=1 Tax=Nocardioides jishulii TaxID=2575440 RepID=A0A4U2YLS1_9ACTN|nr:hypothetical protein [Nocardioides jishulii]QCX27277.1 hypothetical protein FCL41_06875 [Nocardioides jishulii]TKI61764.1 hypothetical protein FC770_13515 [Nocardioides jishulii]